MQNIICATIDNDKIQLLEEFVKDMVVTEIKIDSTDTDRVDPILQYAIKKSSAACVEFLLRRSISTDSVTDCLVRTMDHHVYSSAILAATQSNAKVLDIILRTNPRVRAIDSTRAERLIHFVARSEAGGSVECLKLLLDDHCEDIEAKNTDNETPLHVAASGK